jgi:hypothetical protein
MKTTAAITQLDSGTLAELDAAHAHNRAMRTTDAVGQMIAGDNYKAFSGMVEKFKQEAATCISSN